MASRSLLRSVRFEAVRALSVDEMQLATCGIKLLVVEIQRSEETTAMMRASDWPVHYTAYQWCRNSQLLMCFLRGPLTEGTACNTHLESRITNANPHSIYDWDFRPKIMNLLLVGRKHLPWIVSSFGSFCGWRAFSFRFKRT